MPPAESEAATLPSEVLMKMYSNDLRKGDVIDGWTIVGISREGAEDETIVLSVQRDGAQEERRIEGGTVVEASRNP